MSTENESNTPEKEVTHRYNFKREHHRNWIREGERKIKALPGTEKQARKLVQHANAAERLGEGKGAIYIDKI